ncbi:hypothetical protein ScPMuIL_002859 [Solemya velum]
MERWRGRTALVTGASSGIGYAVAKRFVEYGMNVFGCSRNVQNIEELSKTVGSGSGSLNAIKCDVSNEDEVLAMFAKIRKEHGRLDVCVNSAGISHGEPLLSGTTEKWREMLNINVIGLCICTREAVKLMRESGVDNGHIVLLNSQAGHMIHPRPSGHFYSASKYAVTALTEGFRRELRELKSGIRITGVSPGLVETGFAHRAYGQESGEAMYRSIKCLTADDIADSVIYALEAPDHVQVHDILVRPTEQALVCSRCYERHIRPAPYLSVEALAEQTEKLKMDDNTGHYVQNWNGKCEVRADCKQEPETICQNCDKKICASCITYHAVFHKDHEVTPLYYTSDSSVCKHSEQMEVYCTKCETPMCKVCQRTSHSNHWVESIDNIVENTKTLYRKLEENCSLEFYDDIKERLDQLDENHERTSNQVSEVVERLEKNLDTKVEAIIKRLDIQSEKERGELEKKMSSHNQQQEVLKQIPRSIDKLHHLPPALIWVTQRPLIQSTMNMGRNRQDKDEETARSIIFIPNKQLAKYIEATSLGCLKKSPDHSYDEAIDVKEDSTSPITAVSVSETNMAANQSDKTFEKTEIPAQGMDSHFRWSVHVPRGNPPFSDEYPHQMSERGDISANPTSPGNPDNESDNYDNGDTSMPSWASSAYIEVTEPARPTEPRMRDIHTTSDYRLGQTTEKRQYPPQRNQFDRGQLFCFRRSIRGSEYLYPDKKRKTSIATNTPVILSRDKIDKNQADNSSSVGHRESEDNSSGSEEVSEDPYAYLPTSGYMNADRYSAEGQGINTEIANRPPKTRKQTLKNRLGFTGKKQK